MTYSSLELPKEGGEVYDALEDDAKTWREPVGTAVVAHKERGLLENNMKVEAQNETDNDIESKSWAGLYLVARPMYVTVGANGKEQAL